MAKISVQRRNLLQLMSDVAAEMQNENISFPSFTASQLARYGLTTYDSGAITWAEKAGHIESCGIHGMYRLTEAGKQALKTGRA